MIKTILISLSRAMFCLIVIVAVPQLATAQSKRNVESLTFYIPDSMGYREIFNDRGKGKSILELAPRGQNTKNWRELLSVQTFELGVTVSRSTTTNQMFKGTRKEPAKADVKQWQELMSTWFICAKDRSISDCVAVFPKS